MSTGFFGKEQRTRKNTLSSSYPQVIYRPKRDPFFLHKISSNLPACSEFLPRSPVPDPMVSFPVLLMTKWCSWRHLDCLLTLKNSLEATLTPWLLILILWALMLMPWSLSLFPYCYIQYSIKWESCQPVFSIMIQQYTQCILTLPTITHIREYTT